MRTRDTISLLILITAVAACGSGDDESTTTGAVAIDALATTAPLPDDPAASGTSPTTPASTAPAVTSTSVLASIPASTLPPESDPPAIDDGEQWIAFQLDPTGLGFVRPDGSGYHTILGAPAEPLHPSWSPDGSHLVYVEPSQTGWTLWITDPAGIAPRPLLPDPPPALANLFWDNPAWSPDGTEIAAVGYDRPPDEGAPLRSVIGVIDVATGAIEVADDMSLADSNLHSFPRWSPDGMALVLNVDKFQLPVFLGSSVSVMRRNASGWSDPETILEVGDWSRPDWHPTDDLIVLCTYDVSAFNDTDQPSNLYTVRSDGSNLTQITTFGPGEARATQPTWTSDGRVLFTYITGSDDSNLDLALIDADGSNFTPLNVSSEVGPFNRPWPTMRPVE